MAVTLPRIASGQALVGLNLLEKLGVSKKTIAEINDRNFPTDFNNRVALSVLQQRAKACGVAAPILDKLSELMSTQRGVTPLLLPDDPAAFPKATISHSEIRHNPAIPEAMIDLSTLNDNGAVKKMLEGQKNLSFDPAAKEGVPAFALRDLIGQHIGTLRNSMTLPQIERLLDQICSKSGPATEERDTILDLKPTQTKLAVKGLPEGAGIYRKAGFGSLFIRRKGADFTVAGFRQDSLLVTLPPKCSALLISSDGDQLGVYSSTKGQIIDGKKVDALEISRSLVQPRSASIYQPSPSFTLKILDADKNVVFEQPFKFPKDPGPISEVIARGTVGYRPQPEGDRINELHLNHDIPNPSKNDAPIGERPEITMAGGPPSDQLKIEHDGRTLNINRLAEFLAHGNFKTAKMTYLVRDRNCSEKELDHPEHTADAAVTIHSSYGQEIETSSRGVSFDRDLFGMPQARFTNRGLVISDPNGPEVARFDPFQQTR